MIRNESGQMVAEFGIATLLITLPLLTGGIAWFNWEFDKSKAAYQSFAHARAEMIQTARVTDYQVHFGKMSEDVHLVPLADLDQGSPGLSLRDLGTEGSRLSADASRSLQHLRELASSNSWRTSTSSPKPKSPSTDAPESSL
jgi:hypothetical protein